MKRVLCVLALGVMVTGCAAGEVDPAEPEPVVMNPTREQVPRALGGEVPQPSGVSVEATLRVGSTTGVDIPINVDPEVPTPGPAER